jgi:hypothetical protein
MVFFMFSSYVACLFTSGLRKGRNVADLEWKNIDDEFKGMKSWEMQCQEYRNDLQPPPLANIPIPSMLGGPVADKQSMSDACTAEQWSNVNSMVKL